MPHFDLPNHPRTPYLKLILIYIFMTRDDTFFFSDTSKVHMAKEFDFYSRAQIAIAKAKALLENLNPHKLQIIAQIIVEENLAPSYQLKTYDTLAQIIIEKFGDKIKNATAKDYILEALKLYEKRFIYSPPINVNLDEYLRNLLIMADPNNLPVQTFATLLHLTRKDYPLLHISIIEILNSFKQTNTGIAALLSQETTSSQTNGSLSLSITPFFNTPPNPSSTGTQPLDQPPNQKANKLELYYRVDSTDRLDQLPIPQL